MGECRSFCLCHHLHSCLQAVGFKQSFTFHMIMQIQSCSCALPANTLLRSFLKQSSSYFWILLLSVSATKKVFCSLLATHIHTHAFSVIHTHAARAAVHDLLLSPSGARLQRLCKRLNSIKCSLHLTSLSWPLSPPTAFPSLSYSNI